MVEAIQKDQSNNDKYGCILSCPTARAVSLIAGSNSEVRINNARVKHFSALITADSHLESSLARIGEAARPGAPPWMDCRSRATGESAKPEIGRAHV